MPEIAHAPRILTSFTQVLQEKAFKKDLDSYLRTRAPVTFLSDLRGNLQLSNEPGFRYNISLLNALGWLLAETDRQSEFPLNSLMKNVQNCLK